MRWASNALPCLPIVIAHGARNEQNDYDMTYKSDEDSKKYSEIQRKAAEVAVAAVAGAVAEVAVTATTSTATATTATATATAIASIIDLI